MDDDGVGHGEGVLEADVFLFGDFVYGFLADYVALFGDGCGGDWLVACDHDDLDTSGLALQHGIGHTVSRRVNQRHHPHKALLFEREIGIFNIEVKPMRILTLG